nr:unnamed protein product [Digitaria exilis]
MGQMVKFGRTLSQIGVSRVDAKEGWQQKLNEQRNLELYSKIPKHSEYFEPEETENHIQVAKLHSRSQSLSSAEIFYLLSVNALLSSGNVHRTKFQKYKTRHTNCLQHWWQPHVLRLQNLRELAGNRFRIRGVDGLKMRTISNCPLESQIKSQKDAILLVRTPRGIPD